jgi:hypothetical protein
MMVDNSDLDVIAHQVIEAQRSLPDDEHLDATAIKDMVSKSPALFLSKYHNFFLGTTVAMAVE